MSAYAVSMASSANALAGLVNGGQSGSSDSGVSFASLLNSALNTGTEATGFTTLPSGIRWQGVQSGMMAEAMKALNQSGQAATGDPVLAQLMNLLKNLTDAEGADLAEGANGDLLALVQQMMDRLQEIASENGSQMATAELLAMMSAMGQTAPMDLTGLTGGQSGTDGTGLNYLDGGMVLQAALGGKPEDLLALLTGGTAQATATQPPAAQEAATVADALAAIPGQNEEAQAAEAQQTGATDAQVTAQRGASPTAVFGTTIRQAYEALTKAESQPAKPAQELDVDALQRQVDAGVYLQNTGMAQAPAVEATGTAELPLAQQLGDGLKQALAAGNEQLTIKLAPENLGEVTIRLTRTAQGLSLDIVARSAEAQRLLSAEIEALKEAMKPHKVEVNSILTEQQDAMLNSQQDPRQNDGRTWQPMRGAAYYGDKPLGQSGDVQAAARQVARPTLSGMLDTYI